MSLIARVHAGRTPRPPRLVTYGAGKARKSTFAAGAPRPVFIQTEGGLDKIACDRFSLAVTCDEVPQVPGEEPQPPHEAPA
jgi:hypothetical protein